MQGWMSCKLESRYVGETSTTSDTTLMEEIKEELKSLLMRMKEESERAGLKLKKKKKKDHGFWSHYCLVNRRGKGGRSD